MPLYKKKPFALVGIPEDLKPREDVFQIRFTKEIFRSYNEYLKIINFYRKKVWTCKATGRGNLTYEEALLSEKKASERIQSIPIEYIAPVLRDLQFSMLNLKDLVDSIAAKFQGPYSEGAEVYGRKDGSLQQCKILKVIEDDDAIQYEVEWLASDHKTSGKELVNGDEFTKKDPPFSKRLLKSFIRDSTYRNRPWVLHDNLAKKHGISTDPPEKLRSNISIQNGLVVCSRKRKRNEDKQKLVETSEKELIVYKRRNKMTSAELSMEGKANGGHENAEAQSIKYPIDDLLVQLTEEDRLLTKRPTPCRDFSVTMDCVGNLIMVWDFCTSYGRLLNLSPFSLEDFENSICYKDSTPLLIVESYSALLRFLLDDNGKFFTETEDKKRRAKIIQITWTDYVCDFIETSCPLEMARHTSTIKRGHFALLEIRVKLAIFRELVTRALETDTLREKFDEFIEERQALAATRRDEAIGEGRKKREEKERKKLQTNGKEVKEEGLIESSESDESTPNGVVSKKNNTKASSRQNHSSISSENGKGDSTSKKNGKKQMVETNTFQEDGNLPSKREIHKLMKTEIKESMIEAKSLDQRKEFLEREIEKRVIRNSPLGKDRDYHRYWFFRRDGRIFVESPDSSQWGYYQTKEELDALIGSLNNKGVRERALKKQLQKFYKKICSELEKKTKEDVQNIEMEEALVRRSTRVRAPPREKSAPAFLKYVNKWKQV